MDELSGEHTRAANYHDDAYEESINSPSASTTRLLPALDGISDSDESSPPTPRFMQDRDRWGCVRWMPGSLSRIANMFIQWADGPKPPHIHTIEPLFPIIQEAPMRLLDRYLPRRRNRVLLLMGYYLCWILTFSLVLRASTFASEIAEYGIPINLGCGSTFFFRNNECGIDGNNCRPFSGEAFAFRCPADCGGYQVLNPRAVGAQEIVYRQFVIGGPSIGENGTDTDGDMLYRGDSAICVSAIHAGVVSDAAGGCGVVSTIGEGSHYTSSKRNGITSISFDSWFPVSFTFKQGIACSGAKDLRWPLFAISLAYSAIFSIFCTDPATYFFTLFTAIFVHTGFASDPPPHGSLIDLFSNLIGKFLPATFCAFVLYYYCIRKTLAGLTASFEKTLLWLGAAWFGALSNYTFRWLPISRLTAHDLQQQPGAKVALAGVILVLIVIVIQQVFAFRREGRFWRYISLYALFIAFILISLLIPGLNLRIHHYILALLLIPGTSMQTRSVLVYQGLLVGLFVNGIARWGFDPVLQTSAALQGDAAHDSLLPEIYTPLINLSIEALGADLMGSMMMQTISFNWSTPEYPMDGISVLVNDVERYRGYKDYKTGKMDMFKWTRKVRDDGVLPEYFRFGFMQGSTVWDYTKAGTWHSNGNWQDMEPGPSKTRRRRGFDDEDVVEEDMRFRL